MVHFSKVTKQYGPRILYKNASFQINPGEKVGLVGPNGAGKTTVFRVLSGEEGIEAGSVSKPERMTMGYFSQNIEEMAGQTILQEVLSANTNFLKLQEKIKVLEQQLEQSAMKPMSDEEMAQLLEEYGEAQTEFEQIGGYGLESQAAEILTGLGFPPDEHHRLTESYSGGWKMRVALAKILLLNPSILLMDEPTNHLDMESILWLEEWLMKYQGALLMTSHDRDFMNRLVGKVIEVAHQTITVYGGNYDFYDRERQIRKEQLLASHRRQEEMLAKEQEFISRFAARASHAAQVQSRVKKIEKIERIEIPPEEAVIKFEWPEPPRGGDEVLKFENLGKQWVQDNGQTKLVFSNAKGLVKRLDRVAVVGINGAGKSTLLKIIAGHVKPTEGQLSIGSSIRMGYFSQNSLDVLDSKSTILDEVQKRIPMASLGSIRNLLGAFKFSGEDVEKRIDILSGGEKSRVVLACLLAQAPNLLVLDEPTNHLDIVSREILLEAIKSFPGTVMIVSHDRYFLREITTKVFELDRQNLNVIEGDWAYYLSKKS